MSFDLKLMGGDIVLKNGDLQKVEDTEKLIQDILKILISPQGCNSFNPWYGSALSKDIIASGLDVDMMINIARAQTSSTLDTLKQLQDAQMKSQQTVTANEQISMIKDIFIFRDRVDPMTINIIVNALSKGLKTVSASFQIT